MADHQLDVRELRKPDKHPAIFAAYAELAVGASFVLVNDHNPIHLHDEFDVEHPGSHDWTYVESGPKVWRIRIGKRATTALPRTLINIRHGVPDGKSDLRGAVWKLPMSARDLDSNVIALAPDTGIDTHRGPDLDVLIHVLSGSGQLTTELDTDVALTPGDLVWLPRGSSRKFTAGPQGLHYLTVHQRRRALDLQPPGPRRH